MDVAFVEAAESLSDEIPSTSRTGIHVQQNSMTASNKHCRTASRGKSNTPWICRTFRSASETLNSWACRSGCVWSSSGKSSPKIADRERKEELWNSSMAGEVTSSKSFTPLPSMTGSCMKTDGASVAVPRSGGLGGMAGLERLSCSWSGEVASRVVVGRTGENVYAAPGSSITSSVSPAIVGACWARFRFGLGLAVFLLLSRGLSMEYGHHLVPSCCVEMG